MFRKPLAILLPAALLVAQAGPRIDHREMGERPNRDHIAARLTAIRTRRIEASLAIPEPQAKNLAVRWGQFDLESHDRRQAMRMARQKVQEILQGPGTEEEKNLRVVPPMTQFAAIQKQQRDAKQKFEEDIQKMLTPAQQGRFIILMEDFQRNLLEAMTDQRK